MGILPKDLRDNIEFRHSDDPDRTACWIWTGCLDPRGHGRARHKGEQALAHRLVYEMLRGPIPEGVQLRPTCPHLACVNPAHRELRGGPRRHLSRNV